MRRLLNAGQLLPVLLLAACRIEARPDKTGAPLTAMSAASPRGAFNAGTWQPPADSAIPRDSLGAAIRRGQALLKHTGDSLPAHAPGQISCTNCHLDGGRNRTASSLVGTHARYPKYMDRTGAVVTLTDRVNYCFTRSLAGTRLPEASREMADILAYIAWLSSGVPVGETMAGASGLPAMAPLVGDTARGAETYAASCAVCHGGDGAGADKIVPALWGAGSYSIGASMAREERAASFIWHNMPLGQGKSLTPQQAFDVAAYINAQPRPDSPAKEDDWPAGGAPADVPYATAGHEAYRPPVKLLARRNPAGAVVPKPASAERIRR